MTAATAGMATISVTEAWALYRRSQEIPAGAPDLMNARAGLLRLLEPHTRTYGSGHPGPVPDPDAIGDAADALVAAVEWHLGDEAAAFVAGDSETERAA